MTEQELKEWGVKINELKLKGLELERKQLESWHSASVRGWWLTMAGLIVWALASTSGTLG